jgi:hypothetical protein
VGLRVKDLDFGVWSLEFRVGSFKFGVWGSSLRI